MLRSNQVENSGNKKNSKNW